MTEKYSFDTVFTHDGGVLQERRKTKRSYTPDEVEALKMEAHIAGRTEAEGEMAGVLGAINMQVNEVLTTLIEERTSIRSEAVQLAAAVSKKLAGSLLDNAPQEAVVQLLEGAIDYLRDTPRLVVRVAPDLAEDLSSRLQEVVTHAGFEGQLVVMPEPGLAGPDCKIDWAKGGIEHDIGAAMAGIDKAIEEFLIAARLVDEIGGDTAAQTAVNN